MIVTMFISKRFKLVLRDFCANRSARNLCSKLCVPPWCMNMTFNTKVNKHQPTTMQNSYSSSTSTKPLDAIKSDSWRGMETGLRVQGVGSLVLRYGLVLVIGWIG